MAFRPHRVFHEKKGIEIPVVRKTSHPGTAADLPQIPVPTILGR
jgi:hypothetical protein